jgi:hypothetical protein
MCGPSGGRTVAAMPTFVLNHHHAPQECRSAFAAWHGFDSPLRRSLAAASCIRGEHRIFWTVEADGEDEALTLLPPFVAERTDVSEVAEVQIP